MRMRKGERSTKISNALYALYLITSMGTIAFIITMLMSPDAYWTYAGTVVCFAMRTALSLI